MTIKHSIIKSAVVIATNKLQYHTQLSAYPHFSFIVQDGKLIGYSTNSNHEPPKHYGYHQLKEDKKFKPKFHSEISAYRKVRGILDKKKMFQIINIRLNKKGELKLSKPCPSCWNLLKSLGCNKFYFSSECGFLELA